MKPAVIGTVIIIAMVLAWIFGIRPGHRPHLRIWKRELRQELLNVIKDQEAGD